MAIVSAGKIEIALIPRTLGFLWSVTRRMGPIQIGGPDRDFSTGNGVEAMATALAIATTQTLCAFGPPCSHYESVLLETLGAHDLIVWSTHSTNDSRVSISPHVVPFNALAIVDM